MQTQREAVHVLVCNQSVIFTNKLDKDIMTTERGAKAAQLQSRRPELTSLEEF